MATAVLLLAITYSIYAATSTTQIGSINYKDSLLSSIQSQHICNFYTMKASSFCSQSCLCRYYVFDKAAVNHQCLMCQGYILGTNQLSVQFQQVCFEKSPGLGDYDNLVIYDEITNDDKPATMKNTPEKYFRTCLREVFFFFFTSFNSTFSDFFSLIKIFFTKTK